MAETGRYLLAEPERSSNHPGSSASPAADSKA